MPRLRTSVAPLLLVSFALLPACSFLLDFDGLQKGKGTGGNSQGGGANPTGGTESAGGNLSAGNAGNAGNAGHAGGAGGAGGHGGAAGHFGDAGAAGATCECVDTDTDPCTVARCIDRGNGPECVESPREGLILDRDFTPIVAERHYQLKLLAGPSEFYVSALSTTGGVADATIYRLSPTSTTVTPALELNAMKVAGPPLSAPALAVDTSNGLRIHAFVGMREALGPGARAWHLALDADLKVQLRTPVSTTYAVASSLAAQSQQPSALTAGDETWGAWVNADGTIGVTSIGANPQTIQFGSVTMPASSVTLIAGRTNRPAVLFTSDANGVYTQSEVGLAQLSECQPEIGVYYGAYAAPTSFTGFWAIGWTKSGSAYLTSESSLAICAANTACSTDPACDSNEANNLIRNPAVAAQHLQGDPVGVVYYLDVLPSLVPTSATAFQASVAALLFRIDFGSNPNLSGVQPPTSVGDPLILSTQTTTAAANYRGPDHAAAAIIADTAAIAWIEPTLDGSDQIRVQRYKMCLPR